MNLGFRTILPAWQAPAMAARATIPPLAGEVGQALPHDWLSRLRRGSAHVALTARAFRHSLFQDLPRLPSEAEVRNEGLHFADWEGPVNQQLLQTFGRRHVIYSDLVTANIAGALLRANREYVNRFGSLYALTDYLITQTHERRLESNPEFRSWIEELYYVSLYEAVKAAHLDVSFENMDIVPQEGPVLYAVAPHRTIIYDFLLSLADRRAMPMADAYNFRYNAYARLSGWGMNIDQMGVGALHRVKSGESPEAKAAKKEANRALFEHDLDLAINADKRWVVFINGTRTLTAYEEDRRQAMGGYFSAIPDPDMPEHYVQTGALLEMAKAIARRTQKPVPIIAVTIHDADRVMPKLSDRFPFRQENRAGGHIRYRAVEKFEFSPSDSGRELREQSSRIGRGLDEAFRSDLGIDEYLINDVTREWATQSSDGDQEYADRIVRMLREKLSTKRGLLYLITADRIRSIDPYYPYVPGRDEFQRRYIQQIEQNTDNAKGPLSELLKAVTDVAYKNQYKKFTADDIF